MTTNKLIKALQRLKVETGSIACLGCGHEHNCGIHGCAITKGQTVQLGDFNAVFDEDTVVRLAGQCLKVEPGRLRELAEADKAGRLVVLPCKVGDHVWADGREAIVVWFFGYKTERYLHAQFLDNAEYTDIPFYEIGKTVFLTRQEAEAALKGGDSPENRTD